MRILLTIVFCLFIAINFSQTGNRNVVEAQSQTQTGGQNRFEGYNIFLDAMTEQKQGTPSCATRYVPPPTQITITDLNPSTPFRVASCGGQAPGVRQVSATSATVNASDADYKWCFTGEDKMYRLTFQGDQYAGRITYNWIATPAANDLGFYNVRDFGAVGDGRTDDTTAIRSAIAFIASRGGGGTLRFPEGDYLVGSEAGFKGITLAPGITIEGGDQQRKPAKPFAHYSRQRRRKPRRFPNRRMHRTRRGARHRALFRRAKQDLRHRSGRSVSDQPGLFYRARYLQSIQSRNFCARSRQYDVAVRFHQGARLAFSLQH